MKKKITFIAVLLVASFAASSISAQLRVRQHGFTMLGNNDYELGDVFQEIRDTTTMLKIYGYGTYGVKARLSFGDQFWQGMYNVVLGEAGTGNTDQLWLHGRDGLCATYNTVGQDTLLYFYPLDDEVLNIKCPVRSNGVYLTSDERLKENVEHIDDALSVVSALNGVSYQYRAAQKPAQDDAMLDELAAMDTTGSIARYKTESEKIYANRSKRSTHYGFLAQEVEEVLPELVHTDKDGIKSVDYIAVIPLLVNAIQELRAELTEVKGKEQQNAPAHAPRQTTGTDEIADGLLKPALFQNVPNPFNVDTQIRYFLPQLLHEN